MRKLVVFTSVLLFLVVTVQNGFPQGGSNGSVGGIVQDSSTALIPGVTVTLTNTQTGVVDTRLTNESGVYNFPSVPPGIYKLSGDLTGFTSDIKNNIDVNTGNQIRVDLVLRVGGAPSTSVTVSSESGNSQLRETSSSVGEVLNRDKVHDLPSVGGNVLDLLNVLPGFRSSSGGPQFDTVGGLGLNSVNATINGLSTNSAKQSAEFVGYQLFTPTVINPDLVGEIKLILAPVDAELGRGNSQLQIQTRSGTNKYTGSAVWNIQNSAMDANTWLNNHTPTRENGVQISNSTKPDWLNRNQFTISGGGPILKNKTFFFALYDQQIVRARALQTNVVYTDAAKQGIWRYYPGWNPGNAALASPNGCAASATGLTGTYFSVDASGNPLPSVPNAVCASGQAAGSTSTLAPVTLQCYSVFGNQKFDWRNNVMVPVNPAADCLGGTFLPGPANALNTWDLRRPGNDSTGYLSRILKLMPEPDNWSTPGSGDGLNTAANRYIRARSGSNSLNSQFGVANSAVDQNNRKSINLKLDHNFNRSHRISMQWSYEMDDNVGTSAAPWDGGLNGSILRRPIVFTLNGTSTLSPSLVNEARFGYNTNRTWNNPAWANQSDPSTTEKAKTFLFQGGNDPLSGLVTPIIYNPGTIAGGVMAYGGFDVGSISPVWDYADTIRWTHAKHSFSFGGEYRRPITTGFNSSGYATSTPGNPQGAPAQDLADINKFNTELPNLLQTTRTNSVTLLNLLSGSIATANTGYWIEGYSDLATGQWKNTTRVKDIVPTADDVYGHQFRHQVSNEWSFFAKDDYKIHKYLTLNLGVRYDLNMSPYLGKGLTNRLLDDGVGLYGPTRPLSGDLLANWMVPGDASTGNGLYLSNYGSLAAGGPACASGVVNPAGIPVSNCNPNNQSQVHFVGPETPNPKETLIPQQGRISPAIGFAWQVPWFGEGKTTMRGGYQRTYGGAGAIFAGGLLSGPGGGDFFSATINTSDPAISSILTAGGPAGVGRALTLADLQMLVPGTPTRPPQAPLPIVSLNATGAGGSAITYSMYAPDYVTPYTDNLTLSVTRNISPKYTIDLRFVDTIGQKQPGSAGAISSPGSLNLNQVNVYHNKELYDALVKTRAGLNDPLFDQMLLGVNLNPTVTGYGAVGTSVTSAVSINGAPATNVSIQQRGSAQIRRAFSTALANGDFASVMQSLYNFQTVGSGLQGLPSGVTSMVGRTLRNGCDRIANGTTSGFTTTDGIVIAPRCFAENYLVTNPSFGTATIAYNFGHSNYQSGQVQFTARPLQGMSIQGTYSLSKTMVQPGSGYTDPLNRKLDYGESLNSIGQEFRANSTIELPIGPNKLVMGNSSGWVARAIERWQTSFILVVPEGALRSIVGPNTMYANGRPNVVGPWDNPKGHAEWQGATGTYFGSPAPYSLYVDPQCTNTSLVQGAPTSTATADPGGFNLFTGSGTTSNCTLRGLGKVVPAGTPGAIVDGTGTSILPLLETPLPGQQGNLGSYTMHTVGRWTLDASASKSFRISESKALALRIDSLNILNHLNDGDPAGLIGFPTTPVSLTAGTNFGQITSKSGANRTFQASIRFTF
jgi:hypothetical protein